MKSNRSIIAFVCISTIIVMVFYIGAVGALRGKAWKEEERDIQLLRNIFSSVSFFVSSSFQIVIDFIYFIFNAIIGGFFFFVSSITRTTMTTAPTTTSPATALSSMAITTMPATTSTISSTLATVAETTSVPSTAASLTSAATTAASTTAASTTAASTTAASTTAASTTAASTSTSTTTSPPPPGPKRVFLTSTTHTGDFGGIEGADNICAERASAEGLGGTFAAWISNASVSPSSRFVNTSFPYIRIDNEIFAPNLQSLLDNGPNITLTIIENGSSFMGTIAAWTNTENLGGTRTGSNDCNGWTSTTGATGVGSGPTLQFWSNVPSLFACSGMYGLYCFEQ